MSIRGRLLRKIGKKVGKKTMMTPAKKRALAKAVKASALKRKKGLVSKVKPNIRMAGGKPKASLRKRIAKASKRSAKYDDKAQRVERNMQGSVLKRDNALNIGRRLKLGHFARKSRRLDRKSKNLAKRISRRK